MAYNWLYNPSYRKPKKSDSKLPRLWRIYYRLRAQSDGWSQPTIKTLRVCFSLNGEATKTRLINICDEMRAAGMLDYSWEEKGTYTVYRLTLNDLPDEIPDDAVEPPKSFKNRQVTSERKLFNFFTTLQYETIGSTDKATTKNYMRLASLLTRPGVTLAMAKIVADSYWKMQPGRRKGNNISGFCMQFNDLLDEALEDEAIAKASKNVGKPKKSKTQRERLEQELERAERLGLKLDVKLIKEQLEELNA